MIYISTHRHWGDIRKLLEQDILCDSLRGRVRYFATRYRQAHDQTGRVCILIDDEEIISMPFQTENEIYSEVYRRWPGSGKSRAELTGEVSEEFHERGIYYPGDFGDALDEFLSNQISDSLCSDNWLVRLLAILDRRTGKRNLVKLKDELHSLPDWLQYFYRLRLESEHLL